MATDKNISPEAYIPADTELANQDLDQSIDDVCIPLTSNITNYTVSGDVVFQFSTGQDEYIQLPKTYLGIDYGVETTAGAANSAVGKALAPCLWQNARFEIEGQRVATSNNYTVDWALSNRLQYSADQNKKYNDIPYGVPAAAEPAADESKYTSIDNLAALFYRVEDILLPPNTHYKLTLTPESYETFLQKASFQRTEVQDARLEINIYRIYLNLHRIRRMTKPAGDYSLRFLGIESNQSNPTSATHNIQYQVSSKMRKCGVVLVSTDDRTPGTAAALKTYAPTRFRYADDLTDAAIKQGTIGGHGLQKLQLKSGALMMPNSIHNFDVTGLKEAYLHYLNSTNQYNNGEGETFEEFLKQGPVFVEDSVKSPLDLSTNLQVEMKFVTTPAAYVYTFQINETVLTWNWTGPEGSIPVFAQTAV